LLVINDTQVLPARVFARRSTGGRVELLLTAFDSEEVLCVGRPKRKLPPGLRLELADGSQAEVVAHAEGPLVRVRFPRSASLIAEELGEVPLPPYLGRPAGPDDRERYQTVYARAPGSVAAPTAGLHFTGRLLEDLRANGVEVHPVTLHVGLGTFRPPEANDLQAGVLHPEPWAVPTATAEAWARAKGRGGRVIAVGTTSARTLESAFQEGRLRAGQGTTRLFLRPPMKPQAFDGLLTNFHLPRSSLLMLVACLVQRERLLAAYQEAILRGYRFYSYGDATLLL
jgi:S-adenosylmethionine:tRNA ribosyltransferase-isomerase